MSVHENRNVIKNLYLLFSGDDFFCTFDSFFFETMKKDRELEEKRRCGTVKYVEED
jgi:hypothetical protein